ncbi:MAG TPA: hypothetical protein VIM02_03070 [Rhizomicrobium sp.]|jgi:hypothetical protein
MQRKRTWPSILAAALAVAIAAPAAAAPPPRIKTLVIDEAAAARINDRLAHNRNVVLHTGLAETAGGIPPTPAGDIVILAPIDWNTGATLTIDAYHSIIVSAPVTVSGAGGLVMQYNDAATDGDLIFTGATASHDGNNVAFTDVVEGATQGNLTINGNPYTLVNNLSQLSSAMTANQAGYFALADRYDAAGDGTYTAAPGPQLDGIFEGLGNTVANLKMFCAAGGNTYGLIGVMHSGAVVRDIGMVDVNYAGPTGVAVFIGGVVGFNANGTVVHAYTRGNSLINEKGSHGAAGGLVGTNRNGTVALSFASATVKGGFSSVVGGLVGDNSGTIARSYAVATVACTKGCYSGALAGINRTNGGFDVGTIAETYALGSAAANKVAYVGGLLGANGGYDTGGSIAASYAAAAVTAGARTRQGGFMGTDIGHASLSYWDVDVSGQSQAAGDPPNDPGITGLTTAQFLAGLPAGFDPLTWGQDPSLNNGYPYLLALPPD